MPVDNNIIEAVNVNKTYHQEKRTVQALKDFTLAIPKGSFVCIMGPSGCGKSTITKIIAGIENLDSGSLFIDGQDMSSGVSQDVKKRIGYVFQWHNLNDWLTVEQNLYFPLEMMGMKKDKTWAERARKNLDLVGLYKYRKVFPRELSGGMKQRVGIARSLMMEPDILVFDQPFGALDAITRQILAASFSSAMRKEGKTLLMVTSSAEEAAKYCDYVHIMTPSPGRNKMSITTNVTEDERSAKDFVMTNKFLDLKKRIIQGLSQDEETQDQEES